jgi:hypothetical protein
MTKSQRQRKPVAEAQRKMVWRLSSKRNQLLWCQSADGQIVLLWKRMPQPQRQPVVDAESARLQLKRSKRKKRRP